MGPRFPPWIRPWSDYMNEVLINGCDLANHSAPFEEILPVFKQSNRRIDL